MKKITFFIGSVGLLFASTFSSAEEVTSSEIRAVTLFTDRALVTREARVTLAAGVNDLLLDAAAYDIDADSVQANVFGEGAVLSVQTKEVPLKEPPQENVRALEEKIRQARGGRTMLAERLALVGKKETFLDGIVKFSGTQVPFEIKTSFPKTEDLQKMLGFLDENYGAVNKEKQELDVKIEELDKSIAVMEEELAALKKDWRDYKKVIEVIFDSAKAQEAKVEMSYLVSGASWEPFYKADVPADLKGVTMTMFARIVQTTGEDWKGVKVSVSNAVPLRAAETPSVNSWYLNIVPPRRQPAPMAVGVRLEKRAMLAAEAMPDADALYRNDAGGVGDGDAMAMSLPPAPLALAERKDLALAFEYELSRPLDIESRDKETVVPLFSKSFKGTAFYYTAPLVNPLAFLMLRTAADKEMVGASVNVYFSGRYVGSTYLAEKKPQEEFDINLGADRMVKVRREKTLDKVTETFFKNVERMTVIRQMAYRISVENLKDKPVAVRLVDAVPVAKTDKIEVKDIRLAPEPSSRAYQGREGVTLWEFAVPSGEKRETKIECTVTYPKDAAVSGL